MAWAGGGTGLGKSSSFQVMNAGARLGRVLTAGHGPGFLHGNFEYCVEGVPLYLFFQNKPAGGRQTVYGGALSPLILKWNFTSGKRIVPFGAIEESVIFTTRDVPAGNTSQVNFGSGVASGVQILQRGRHAVSASAHLLHISNASMGQTNPGINVGVQFRLGLQWWK